MEMASIKEGDVTRNFSGIDRLLLKTSVSGSETSVWIPDSQTKLDTLRAKENGSYVVPDGVYGWKTVYVGVDKSRESITGKKNGQPVIVRRSSNGGGGSGGSGSGTSGAETPLITENVPHKIVVTVNPTKTEYWEGETIDYTGIVVTAYNSDDTVWTGVNYPDGIIPFEELTFPVTTAEIPEGAGVIYTDVAGLNCLLISYTRQEVDGQYVYQHALGQGDYPYSVGGMGEGEASIYLTKYENALYACRLNGENSVFYRYTYLEDFGPTPKWIMSGSFPYRTTLGAFTAAPWGDSITDVPESTIDPVLRGPGNLVRESASVSTPVQWQSEYQADAYETYFNIEVSTI